MELEELLIQIESIADSDDVKLREFSNKIKNSSKLNDLDKILVQNFIEIKSMYNKFKFSPESVDLESYLSTTMDNYRNVIHDITDNKYRKK